MGRRFVIPAVGVLAVALALTLVLQSLNGSAGEPPEGDGEWETGACSMSPDWATYVHRGWDPHAVRDWDLAVIPKEKNWFGSFETTSHSGPSDYLQKVPLVFYGPGFIDGSGPLEVQREVTLADVAPTQARLMNFASFDRTGTPLKRVLADSAKTPPLIVTLIIDGGGWNVLKETRGTWPTLDRLMEEGRSVRNVVVGSSPTITPAVHSTLSTGSYPKDHGVMAIVARSDEGDIVGGFSREPYEEDESKADPTVTMDMTTLADEWDLEKKNRPEIAGIMSQNFHLGMVGKGASVEGADKDIVALTQGWKWATNPDYYSLPSYSNSDAKALRRDVHDVDLIDGKADGLWRGHGLFRIDATPAYAYWQTRLLQKIITRENFGDDGITDLVYMNYKAPDAAGHQWNMIRPEQRDTMRSVDKGIGNLLRFLNRKVGRGRYVVTITADHGQTPLDGPGWPIRQGEVADDIEAEFDETDNGQKIVRTTTATLYFMNRDEMELNGVTPEDIADFLSTYTIGDNVRDSDSVPKSYKERVNEMVFKAVVPGVRMDEMAACAGARTD